MLGASEWCYPSPWGGAVPAPRSVLALSLERYGYHFRASATSILGAVLTLSSDLC